MLKLTCANWYEAQSVLKLRCDDRESKTMNSRVEQMQLIEKGDHEGRALRNQKRFS